MICITTSAVTSQRKKSNMAHKYKKPTVAQALRERDAKLSVTVHDNSKLFADWPTYQLRFKLAMLLLRIVGWLTAMPVNYEYEEEK